MADSASGANLSLSFRDALKYEKGGTVKDSDLDDAHGRELLDGLGDRLHDAIALFLCDHPEVPPALVGLTVGRVFLFRQCRTRHF
jgi:hypothetical protein